MKPVPSRKSLTDKERANLQGILAKARQAGEHRAEELRHRAEFERLVREITTWVHAHPRQAPKWLRDMANHVVELEAAVGPGCKPVHDEEPEAEEFFPPARPAR